MLLQINLTSIYWSFFIGKDSDSYCRKYKVDSYSMLILTKLMSLKKAAILKITKNIL